MRITRADMGEWVIEALHELGGIRHFLEIAKRVYEKHEREIRAADGDYFYKWQYEMRWAGALLQKQRRLKKNALGRRGVWALPEALA